MAVKRSADAEGFYRLIGQALVDKTYRDRILDKKKQKQTLAEALGRDVTPAELVAFRRAVAALDKLYGSFDARKRYSA